MEDLSIKQILSQCALSTRMTALTFFPERFYMPFAEEVHGKIFDLIDGPEQKVAIADYTQYEGFRGIAYFGIRKCGGVITTAFLINILSQYRHDNRFCSF